VWYFTYFCFNLSNFNFIGRSLYFCFFMLFPLYVCCIRRLNTKIAWFIMIIKIKISWFIWKISLFLFFRNNLSFQSIIYQRKQSIYFLLIFLRIIKISINLINIILRHVELTLFQLNLFQKEDCLSKGIIKYK
jgi:hypothetical protein